MKILYVAPHLSTGGMPQYLYEQAKHFAKDFQIEVVDVTNSGGDSFVVQKSKIAELFPVHTLSDKTDLLKIISQFNPDIIHYQEIPEDFLPENVLDVLFAEDSTYFNVVTTHSSYTNPDRIKYHADRYVFVSEWSLRRFEHLGIESEIWDYPIIEHVVDKKAAQEQLMLDPEWKHVLHVGLFTPGKNQAELIEIARQLQDERIMFHFVGNQAGNFKEYWEPLMEDLPLNCYVWGERHDVHNFYSAMDVFYFPSKFELSPIAIKEALGHGLPCMFRRLHTYLDMYDGNPQVTYITEGINENKSLLLKVLKNDI
jgi:glycosyltransferase involved in cell wall biosynthesis